MILWTELAFKLEALTKEVRKTFFNFDLPQSCSPRDKDRCEPHRRTGNFLPGGAVNHLPKKILASVPNFYRRVETKRGPYCNNIGRTGV